MKIGNYAMQPIDHFWPETSLQRRLMPGVFSNANNINLFNDIPPHETPLHASSSPIPRMRIWSIKDDFQ